MSLSSHTYERLKIILQNRYIQCYFHAEVTLIDPLHETFLPNGRTYSTIKAFDERVGLTTIWDSNIYIYNA